MIRVQQIKLKIPHTDGQLHEKIRKILRISKEEIVSVKITKRQIYRMNLRKNIDMFLQIWYI